MTRAAAAATLALLMLSTAPVAAQAPEDRAADISREVMSPFCPGLTLHDCPTQEASDLRARIERWAAAGWSDERITTALEEEYGEGIRSVPDEDAYLMWLVPGVVLAGGLVLAYLASRRWARTGTVPSLGERSAAPTGPEERRLRTELEGMKERFWGRM